MRVAIHVGSRQVRPELHIISVFHVLKNRQGVDGKAKIGMKLTNQGCN